LTVAGSVIFAVKSQGSKKTEVDRTLPDPKHDTSDLVLLNESALPDKTREASSAAMSETTRLAKADIVETLITDLHSQDADKRRQGIWELGQRGDSRAIQPLVDLLMDSDSRQRSLILAAVSEIAVRSLKPMNRALMFSLQDESPDVRKNAIRDVTRIYDAMAQMSQLLHYAASDTDIEVQDTAHWALSQMNRMRSLPESEALSSSSEGKFKEQLSSEKMLEDQKPRE
jgi:HEAT repeat protein